MFGLFIYLLILCSAGSTAPDNPRDISEGLAHADMMTPWYLLYSNRKHPCHIVEKHTLLGEVTFQSNVASLSLTQLSVVLPQLTSFYVFFADWFISSTRAVWFPWHHNDSLCYWQLGKCSKLSGQTRWYFDRDLSQSRSVYFLERVLLGNQVSWNKVVRHWRIGCHILCVKVFEECWTH